MFDPLIGLAKARMRALSHLLYFRSLAHRDHVRFLGHGVVYFDPADGRATWLRQSHGVTQPSITALWRRANRLLRPEVVLDIGANYGEISLSCDYPADTRLYLFEPNPAIVAHLRRSAGTHTAASRIAVEQLAVSEGTSRMTLNVDPRNSGASSVRARDDTDIAGVVVETTSIDAYLQSRGTTPRTLTFKIDVEGWECFALRGMSATLGAADRYIGLIEYDREFLAATPYGPEALVRTMRELGACGYIGSDNKIRPFTSASELPEHTDIVLARDSDLLADMKVSSFVRSR